MRKRSYKYTVKELKTGRVEVDYSIRDVAAKFRKNACELYNKNYEIIKEFIPDTVEHYEITDIKRNLTVSAVTFNECLKKLGFTSRTSLYNHPENYRIICDGKPYVIEKRNTPNKGKKYKEEETIGRAKHATYRFWKITQFDFSTDVLILTKRTNYKGFKTVEEMQEIKDEFQKIINGFGYKNNLVFDINEEAVRCSGYHYLIMELHIKLPEKTSFKKKDFEITSKKANPVIDAMEEYLNSEFEII